MQVGVVEAVWSHTPHRKTCKECVEMTLSVIPSLSPVNLTKLLNTSRSSEIDANLAKSGSVVVKTCQLFE